jgi:hypothetical protein
VPTRAVSAQRAAVASQNKTVPEVTGVLPTSTVEVRVTGVPLTTEADERVNEVVVVDEADTDSLTTEEVEVRKTVLPE